MSFEEVYHTTKNRVFNLALQYVQNSADAEEITQDVFVKVYHAQAKFREESALFTWIYRITVNASLDHLKSRNRKKRFGRMTSIFRDNSAELRHDHPEFNHPGVLLEQEESMRVLFGHLNTLPDNQRTALILTKIEQHSQAETAAIMNISPKAVESLVQRARMNLEKKLNSSEGL